MGGQEAKGLLWSAWGKLWKAKLLAFDHTTQLFAHQRQGEQSHRGWLTRGATKTSKNREGSIKDPWHQIHCAYRSTKADEAGINPHCGLLCRTDSSQHTFEFCWHHTEHISSTQAADIPDNKKNAYSGRLSFRQRRRALLSFLGLENSRTSVGLLDSCWSSRSPNADENSHSCCCHSTQWRVAFLQSQVNWQLISSRFAMPCDRLLWLPWGITWYPGQAGTLDRLSSNLMIGSIFWALLSINLFQVFIKKNGRKKGIN